MSGMTGSNFTAGRVEKTLYYPEKCTSLALAHKWTDNASNKMCGANSIDAMNCHHHIDVWDLCVLFVFLTSVSLSS